jgi:hypothetical protein
MKPFNKRMRHNGQTSLFHTRADLNILIEFCNKLAEKVDELIAENNRLHEKIERMESEDTE